MSFKTICLFLFSLIFIQYSWSQKIFFSGNDDNSIFICEDGRVFMSGENNTGQLGIGSFVPSNIPVELGGINGSGSAPGCKQAQIEGVSTFLALTNSGDTVLAWGPNDFGQVGDGTTDVKTFPVIVKGVGGAGTLENITQIATGNYTSYALNEEGKVLSWGANSYGQTGSGDFNSPVLFPVYVLKAPGDTLKNVKTISAGGVFAMALLCDGTVWAWGRNNLGQLAQNTTVNSEYAVQVKNSSGTGFLTDIIKIEAGDNYAFALSATDTLWCWGPNWDGRLGTGNYSDYLLPGYVRNTSGTAALSGVIDVAAGQGHGLVLLADQSVYAWGVNNHGQLGVNDTTDTSLPVRVMDPAGTGYLSGVNYVATGDDLSLARTDDNQIYIWGGNTLGQLGLNDHVHRLLPVPLPLSCEPTPDTFPGNGILQHAASECIGANSGMVFLTRHHTRIVEWQWSSDNFSSYNSIPSKEFSNAYSNLVQPTSYRAVLQQCGYNYYSPIGTIAMDSLTVAGSVQTSTSVRKYINQDTLRLVGYKGSILRWEYSTDNFVSDIQQVASSFHELPYSNLAQTTYYRALVQRGNCPAQFSDTAEIKMVDQSAIKIYNGFTPDGDNYNDEWVIDFIELFPSNRVEIYNRWGQLVYRTSAYDNVKNVWKGENNVTGNQLLADGTYFYVVDPGEGHPVLKGFVVISR